MAEQAHTSEMPPGPSPLVVPPELLRRLQESVLSEPEPGETLPDWSTRPLLATDATWQEAVEVACTGHGVSFRSCVLSVREAAGLTSDRTPLVICTTDSEQGTIWALLVARRASRVRVAIPGRPERWMRPSELAECLGVGDVDEPLGWLVAEPMLPSGPPVHEKRPKLPPVRRLAKLVEPDRADLWTVVLYAIMIGGLTLTTPIAVQQLVNSVAFGGLVQPVVVLALFLFAGLTFSALLSALQAIVAESIQRRVFVRVVMDLAQRLPRVEASAFDSRHGPELVNRIFDVVTVQKVGARLLLEGTSVVLQTGVGLLVLSFYHPWMLAFSVLLIGAVGVVVFVFGRGAVATAIGESNAKYAIAGWMEELARHPAAFRSAEGREYAVARADALASAYVGARERHFHIVLRQLSSALGLQVLAGSALLALGGGLVVDGQLTLGQLVASELILTAIVAAVAKLAKQLEGYYDLLAGVDKLGMLFDLPLEREDGDMVPSAEGPATVALHDVSFGFEDGPRIVDSLSLRIEAGQHTALIGPTGTGKSTLLDLLAGLRLPSEGFITIDDDDYRDLSLDAIRRQVVYVGDPEIFTGSVLDNVRVSAVGSSIGELRWALDRVGLLEELRALPKGLQTTLSTNGDPLSRGQIARLMLARAIAAEPRLILLDSAFVQLSEEHAKRALDAIFAPDAPWTAIAVSDRADVLDRCTRVVEMRSSRPDEPARED